MKETHWRLGKWAKDGLTKTGRQRWRFRPTRGEYVRFVAPEVVPKREEHGWHKRPSLFMPRWASRILLEVEEDTRQERLQDISAEDAIAEGIETCCGGSRFRSYGQAPHAAINHYAEPRASFETLWCSLHTKPGERWEDNPTVYRVGRFHRIEGGSDAQ